MERFSFERRFRVRTYECDCFGLVGIAGLQHYFEQTASEASGDVGYELAWYVERQTAWILRGIQVELLAPIAADERIAVRTWAADFQRTYAQRDYLIALEDGRIAARASATWVYVDRQRGRPQRIPADMLAAFEILPRLELAALPGGHPERGRWAWEHEVRSYEIDTIRHVNNAVYLRWCAEGMAQALAQAGWPLGRWMEEGLQFAPASHQTDYLHPATYGDAVQVQSTVVGTEGDRLSWAHAVVRASDGRPLVRSLTSYQCLDSARQPRAVPPDLAAAVRPDR
ncbi:MAG TPA: thioesterase family protein [Herpetosiphonaceae bacterium]